LPLSVIPQEAEYLSLQNYFKMGALECKPEFFNRLFHLHEEAGLDPSPRENGAEQVV